MNIRVAFCGVPGSGKSTLARSFSGIIPHYFPEIKTIELVQEYAREYLSKFGTTEHVAEQLLLFEKQLVAENSLNPVPQLMVSDSPIFLAFKYAQDLSRGTLKGSKICSEIFSKLQVEYINKPRYDLVFYLNPRTEVIDDGVRLKNHYNSTWQVKANNHIKGIMATINQPYIEVPNEKQLEFCIQQFKIYLDSFDFQNEE